MPKVIKNVEEKLIVAAEELFIQEDYDAVNMRKIAKHAGVASGTVYNYFSSKEALYQAVLMKSWDISLKELDLIRQESLGLSQKLKKFMTTLYMGVVNRKGLGGRLIVEERKGDKNKDSETEKKLVSHMSYIQDHLVGMLNESDSLKQRIPDTGRLASMIVGSFWVLQRQYEGEVDDNLRFIENLLDTLIMEEDESNEQ